MTAAGFRHLIAFRAVDGKRVHYDVIVQNKVLAKVFVFFFFLEN